MRIKLAVSVFLLMSLAILAAAVNKRPQSQQAPPQAAGAVAPIELYRNHIFAKVRINGSEPLNFIVDTGASVTTLSDKRAQELGLELHNQQTMIVGAGTEKSKIATAYSVRFTLAGKDVTAKNVMVLSLAELELLEGHRIDGVLGVDLFDQYVVKVDYGARTLTLFDPANYVYSGTGEAIPVKRQGGWIMVPVTITMSAEKSVKADFAVDTGSGRALGVNSPLVKEEHLLSPDRPALPTFGAGVGGEYSASLGRVQSIQIGGFRFKNLVANFSTATQGATSQSYAGEVGGEIFRRFTVIFDYRRERVILEPNSSFSEPFQSNMSGVLLAATSGDFKTFKVLHVLPGSPAAEAGLQQGDLFLEVNGKPAGESSIGDIEKLFKQEGLACAIKVKRDQQILEMTIRTRKLI